MKALTFAALVLAAGCVSTPDLPPVRYYVLRDSGPAAQARPAGLKSRALLVQPTSVAAFYDTQRLVYSRSPSERAYYQFAAWTERPGRAFSELLSERLNAPSTTSGARGHLVLRTRLEEICHDVSVAPGTLRIEVSAELIDSAGRLIGERRRFVRSVPVGEENAAAAVEAANRAVAEVLDDIAAWLDGQAADSVARS
jgi:cholesterol transport system auxiliary component